MGTYISPTTILAPASLGATIEEVKGRSRDVTVNYESWDDCPSSRQRISVESIKFTFSAPAVRVQGVTKKLTKHMVSLPTL